jgi:hypothetical protein
MSTALAVTGAALLVGSAVLGTLAVLAVWARVRYARSALFFRCRLGPPSSRRRSRRARWRLRRSWAAWVDDVLVVRSGAWRLWLTPLSVGVAGDVKLQALEPGEARGLGPRPFALRLTVRGAGELEIAVSAEDADLLVGPFLTAALSGLPGAPRGRGG